MNDHSDLDARLDIQRQILAEALALLCFSHPQGQAAQRVAAVRTRLQQLGAHTTTNASQSSVHPGPDQRRQAQAEEARELLAHLEVALREIQAGLRHGDVAP